MLNMRYNFDAIISREGTDCYKYDGREHVFGRADVIPVWVADMDFAVMPEITEAMRRRLEHPIYGYTFRPEGFFDSVVQWVKRRNGWNIRREWIDFTPGVVPGFAFGIRAFTKEGEGVLIQPPVYHPFAGVTRDNGRTVVDNPLKEVDGRYEIDFADLDRKLSGAKVFLMCNPHNPTGRVFTKGELMEIGKLCVKHDVVILADEIHSDIIQPPHKHIHIASLSEEFAARTVTYIAPSKTFNLAALSTAVSITSNKELFQRLHREYDTLHIGGGNVFGNIALETAYTHGDRWLDQMNAYIGGNMDYVIRFLGEKIPSVKCVKPEGTYMMWLDFRAWNKPHKEIVRFLIDRAGLGFNEGSMFGAGGEGFMRMNVATQRATVERAMNQLYEAI